MYSHFQLQQCYNTLRGILSWFQTKSEGKGNILTDSTSFFILYYKTHIFPDLISIPNWLIPNFNKDPSFGRRYIQWKSNPTEINGKTCPNVNEVRNIYQPLRLKSLQDLLVKISRLITPVNKIVINIGPETQVNCAPLRDIVLKKLI